MLTMFFAGTVGIVLGGPLAIIIVSWFSPETVGGQGPNAVWRGLTTVAGSWIGGAANQTAMKEVFEEFAKEERQHKARLLGVKKGEYLIGSAKKILDMKIGDYLTDVKPSSDLTYQQALNLAMKAEKAAYMMYSDLAKAADHADTKQLFLDLAQEEAKHKLRFEVEYDEFFLKEN